jgi:hypothetical protein
MNIWHFLKLQHKLFNLEDYSNIWDFHKNTLLNFTGIIKSLLHPQQTLNFTIGATRIDILYHFIQEHAHNKTIIL